MKTTSFPKRNGYLALGGSGLAFSMIYLGASLQMPFGKMDMPGSALFPIFSGAMLTLASLATVWEGWQMDTAERVEFPTGANLKRLLLLLGSMFGYLLALPWLGQVTSSMLFCALLLRLLSELGWLRIAAYSLLISIVLYVVFVSLLKVNMPAGVLVF